jgi:RNA polymerase sigma factor (sigma-70 family)
METYYAPTDVLTHVELTPEQEASLFERFYTGEEKDALAARDQLIENNLRYAASLALRHSSKKKYQKDLISAANLGLIKALESRRFRPAQGRFTTFATKYILGEICATFRVSGAVSFPSGRLPDWPEDSLDPDPDTMSDSKAFSPEHLDHQALHDAILTLDDQQRALVELIFFGGENLASAARILKLSRQWATELRDRALANLRARLNGFVPFPGAELNQKAA